MLVTNIVDIDKKRKKVFLDYEFTFSLYNAELRKFGIVVDGEIDESTYENINEIVLKRVKARALYILKASQKTRKQLKDKLIEGGYTETQAECAVQYAESYGYIDDKYYASYYVEMSSSKRSKSDMRRHLMQRGISEDIIDSVLAEAQVDEAELILNFMRKKSISLEEFSQYEYKEKNKIYASLFRKGFSAETVRRVLNGDFSD